MITKIAVPLVAFVVYSIYSIYTRLQMNIAAAKRSGLPYVVTPIGVYNPLWLATFTLFLPLLRRLPKSWTASWINYMTPDWCWQTLYEPFERTGDSFLLVSFDKVSLYTSSPEAINQITARRDAFPKPIESYQLLSVFGRNMVSTEGTDWKRHRKVISPNLNEKNNAMVFAESCNQAQQMLDKWGADDEKSVTIKEAPTDTMRLALYMITRVGFGIHLLRPEAKAKKQDKELKDPIHSSNKAGEGHTMSFEKSLSTLTSNVVFVGILPHWLLKRLPFQQMKLAYESYLNFGQYMREMLEQKIEETRQGKMSKGMDILGALVRSSYGKSAPTSRTSSPGKAEKGEVYKSVLSDSEILGNCFVVIFAGHETTANSIHFAIVDLAINTKPQREAQKHIEAILGDEAPETWDYDSCINQLLGSMLGAIMNEQLRLAPPAINIPKSVSKTQDQVIELEGQKVTLPAGAMISLNTIGVQRNPKYWPTCPSDIHEGANDLDDFKPERWIVKSETKSDSNSSESQDVDEYGGFTGQDTSTELFRPVPGSYVPFSAGAHSCVGRRLAQVEFMAVFAVIFQKYSIELAVDEWATDEEVEKMSKEERRAVYKKAQVKARETLRKATLVLTLKLDPHYVPLRVVKKGCERFFDVLD